MGHHSQDCPEGREPESAAIRKLTELAAAAPVARALRHAQAGLQGEYPGGRVNAEDEGAVAMAVGSENGRVFLAFPHPTAWVGLEPAQAMVLATDLIKHARACGAVCEFVIGG